MPHASMAAASLADVLTGIQSAILPKSQKQFLLLRATERAQRGQVAERAPPPCATKELEDILQFVGVSSGAEDPVDIAGAKRWLRDHGQRGRTLASRLGKLTTVRNAQCHPRPGTLLEAVRRLNVSAEPDGVSEGRCLQRTPLREASTSAAAESLCSGNWLSDDSLQSEVLPPVRV